MMQASTTTSLRRRQAAAGSVQLLDSSCGACEACLAGGRLWCRAPADGQSLGPTVSESLADSLEDALVAASAFVSALAVNPHPEPVLVTGTAREATAVFVRRVFGGEVLVATGTTDAAERELRAVLAQRHPSGRAGLIVTDRDLRSAVKSVRRGGSIATTPTVDGLPSVTEVVQREVAIVGARDVTALIAKLTGEDWAAAIASLAAREDDGNEQH